MDICYVTLPNYPTRRSGKGQDRYAYELIKGASQFPRSNVLALSSPVNKGNYLIKELETISRLRGICANVYHATSEYGLRSILVTRKRHTVVTVHDLIPYLFLRHSPIVYANQLMHLSLVRLADRIITHSRFYGEFLARVYKIPAHQVEVTYYGVDHNIFQREIGRSRNPTPRILFLGGLSQLKGVGDVIEAFANFSKSSDGELVIAGQGKRSKDLKELASRLNVSKLTTFPGFVDEDFLPQLYNSVDLVVWPSRSGFGLPILEAMACGTPVIAADCLDAKEYLGEGGLSYAPGDIPSLDERMHWVLESERSWRLWSERALKRSENFSWEQMAYQVCQSYLQI